MKTKQQRERERQLKIIRRIGAGIIVGGALVIGIIVFFAFHRNVESEDVDNSYAQWAVDDSNNFSGAEVNNGNVSQLNALYSVVREYLNYFENGEYSYIYDRFYDNDVLHTYGYDLSVENFVVEQGKIATMYHTYKKDIKHIQISYSAVTYQDCKTFFLYTFNLQYMYYDDNGNIKATPMVQQTYTLIPYTQNDVTSYKLLDFDITEIDTQVSRFDTYSRTETNVNGTSSSPAGQETETSSENPKSTDMQYGSGIIIP